MNSSVYWLPLLGWLTEREFVLFMYGIGMGWLLTSLLRELFNLVKWFIKR